MTAAASPARNAFHHARHRWLNLAVRDKALSGAAIRVAVLLWEHMNVERGCAWPSFDYMARQLTMHRSTVIRALRQLKDHGWITICHRGGRHNSNEYRLAFGKMETL